MQSDKVNKLKVAGLVGPTVHLNGTGGEDLYEQYLKAINALNEAMSALPAPHGRDYYVNANDKAFEQARAQHVARLDRLKDVLEELKLIAHDIVDQRDFRRR